MSSVGLSCSTLFSGNLPPPTTPGQLCEHPSEAPHSNGKGVDFGDPVTTVQRPRGNVARRRVVPQDLVTVHVIVQSLHECVLQTACDGNGLVVAGRVDLRDAKGRRVV